MSHFLVLHGDIFFGMYAYKARVVKTTESTAVMPTFKKREMQKEGERRKEMDSLWSAVYSTLAFRCNERSRNRWNVWLSYIKARVGVGGVAGMLLQQCASNAAWSLPELNSKLGRRGWRRDRSRGEGVRRAKGEKMRGCFCYRKENRLKKCFGYHWWTPVYSRAEKWQFPFHTTQVQHTFEAMDMKPLTGSRCRLSTISVWIYFYKWEANRSWW